MTRHRPPEPTADFLRRLDRGLRSLPRPVRAAACAEIEAHIAERRAAPSADLATILAALGDPDVLARGLRDAHVQPDAHARAASGQRLAGAVASALRRLSAFGVGSAAGLLYVVGAAFLLVAAMKPVTPGNVGLWSGHDGFAFGLMSDPGPLAQERLGLWIMPVAALAALGCCLAASALLRGLGIGPRRPLAPEAA